MAPIDGQSDSLIDKAWEFVKPDNPFELDHHYGDTVHVLNDPALLTLIARAGFPGTEQHILRQAIGTFYKQAFGYLAGRELGQKNVAIDTNMKANAGDRGVYRGPVLDLSRELVLVSIERGGAKPTQDLADYVSLATGASVRIDSVTAERQTDDQGKVIGCSVSGSKISGPVDGKILIFPDPMGATGRTIDNVTKIYRGDVPLTDANGEEYCLGGADKMIALHLIVAPEYLAHMRAECPDVVIYAGRVDRGLSSERALRSKLGSYPAHGTDDRRDLERGLNDVHYIVPGAGGIGEGLSGEVQQSPFYE
jgi:uracil phosphoribosyltransferase